MLMNDKTRPVCHGRMGKGNNCCSHMIARVLVESLLGAVKSKANHDIMTRLICHWHCCFYSFSAQNWINLQKQFGNGNWNRAMPVVDICFGIDWELVRKKYHENSGGYVCVYCIL